MSVWACKASAEITLPFDGFDGDSTFTWDKAEELSVREALDVPGAVAVSYEADGDPGVMGLR